MRFYPSGSLSRDHADSVNLQDNSFPQPGDGLQMRMFWSSSAYWILTNPDFSGEFSYMVERYGRHDWTRTGDLYRVNFEVTPLKPLAPLLFRFSKHPKCALNSLVLVTNW
jgi:hypothetical protein